jgi:hypothetical protein
MFAGKSWTANDRLGEIEMDQEFNPYAAPETPASPPLDSVDGESSEAIRQRHLSHESSLKSLGFLYMLGGIVGTVGAVSTVYAMLSPGSVRIGAFELLAILVLTSQLFIGNGLRRLRRWARWPATALAAIGLLGFPIGTLISAYFLYLLISPKGGMVLSPEYQQVIAETPHIRHRTSRVLVALLILLIFVIFFLVVGLLVGGRF